VSHAGKPCTLEYAREPIGMINQTYSKLNSIDRGVWVAIAISVVFFLICFTFLTRSQPLAPVTDASPYLAPTGCLVNRAELDTNKYISCACADDRYRISDALQRGLVKSGRGPTKFYRVGNDAAQLEPGRDPKECWVGTVARNFFVVR
jgi:hypothetical protein